MVSDICTCIAFNSSSRLRDCGPGISVIITGPCGSFIELVRHLFHVIATPTQQYYILILQHSNFFIINKHSSL